MYGLSVVTAPAQEPVSLAEAKAHLRVEHDDEDAYINALIKAARSCVESDIHRALVTQTLKQTLDRFPGSCGVIRLARSPVRSITSVTYIDDAGDSQTMDAADYRLDNESLVSRLTPAYGESWPTTRPVTNAVAITFSAGYGAPPAVPEAIKQAILLVVGTYFDTVRGTTVIGTIAGDIPRAAAFLLGPYKVATHPGAG